MKFTKIIIRVGSLLIIILLGLIIVFPQSLDLMDIIFTKNTSRQEAQRYNDKYSNKLKQETNEKGFFHFLTRDIAPTRKKIESYLLNLQYTTNVLCIGKIPKITFDEENAKILPPNPFFTAQILTDSMMSIPTLKTVNIYPQPKIRYVGWFRSNTAVKGWEYKMRVTQEKYLSQTTYDEIAKGKVRVCR